MTRWARKLAPPVLGVGVFGATALQFLDNDNPLGEEAALLIGLACGVAACLARRWVLPLFAVAAAGWLTLSLFPAMAVAAYYGAVRLTRRPVAIAFLLGASALVLVPNRFDITGWFTLCVLIGLPYAVGLWVNARRQVVAGLRERAERLESEQAARAEQARQEERTRIAREMHDVVAHRVALMVLHAGAMEVNAPDERSAGEAALIRTTGREALTELRQVLGVLRTDEASLAPQPDLSELPRLLDQTRAAGVQVDFHSEGTRRELPTVVQRTAFRVVQEALTNVVKHAAGARAAVTLRYSETTLEIRVENGAPAAGRERLPGSGLGLIGLRERVALLYGRFESRARLDGGFTISAVLPASPTDLPA